MKLLAQEVVAFEAGRLLARARACPGSRARGAARRSDARGQVVAALVDGDLGVGVVLAQARDGGGDEPGERGWEGADAQPGALAVGGDGELVVGELEALGDGVGVLEQDLALAGEPQAAGLALQQPRADLALQRTRPGWRPTAGTARARGRRARTSAGARRRGTSARDADP